MKLLKIIGIAAAMGMTLGVTSVASAASYRYSDRVRASNPRFAKLDRNRNGRIERFEYRRMARKRFKRWVRTVDLNRDGRLTRREKALARRTRPIGFGGRLAVRGPVKVRALRKVYMRKANQDFRRLDRNRNGVVSRREFRRAGRVSVAVRTPTRRYGPSVFRSAR